MLIKGKWFVVAYWNEYEDEYYAVLTQDYTDDYPLVEPGQNAFEKLEDAEKMITDRKLGLNSPVMIFEIEFSEDQGRRIDFFDGEGITDKPENEEGEPNEPYYVGYYGLVGDEDQLIKIMVNGKWFVPEQ